MGDRRADDRGRVVNWSSISITLSRKDWEELWYYFRDETLLDNQYQCEGMLIHKYLQNVNVDIRVFKKQSIVNAMVEVFGELDILGKLTYFWK